MQYFNIKLEKLIKKLFKIRLTNNLGGYSSFIDDELVKKNNILLLLIELRLTVIAKTISIQF